MRKQADRKPGHFSRIAATAIAVSLLLAMLLPRHAAALPLLERSYTMTADYIMFDIDKKVAYCEGRSEMSYGLMRIQAQKLRVDAHTHVLYAEGKVTIETMARRADRAATATAAAPGNMVIIDGSTFGANPQADKEAADKQAQQIQESIHQGNVQTFDGDVLIFDLVNYAGVITKTKEEVSRTYLFGETLDIVARMPAITEPEYLFEEPEIMTNAWTAKRLRINPGNLFESWQTMMWFKGNKVIPTNIPYYTNSPKGITPGNLRLKTVHYSSNGNWNLGALYTYSKKKNSPGSVSLDYSGKDGQAYKASLSQGFKLTKNMSGTMGLGNLFSSGGSYSMSLNRSLGGSKYQRFNALVSKGGRKSFSMNDNRNLFGARMIGNLSLGESRENGQKSSTANMLVNLMYKNKYFGPGNKIGMSVKPSFAFDKGPTRDADSSFFVALSMFRTAKRIDRKSHLSSNFNVGFGMHSDGYSKDSFGTNLNADRDIGKNKKLGVSYSIAQNTSKGNPRATQTSNFSYSLAKQDLVMSLSSSYNIRANDLSAVSSRFSYNLNKRCTIWNDLGYDLKAGRFNTKNFSFKYNLYGSDINARWFAESNDLSVDLSSHF